jgi:TolA-binding protein
MEIMIVVVILGIVILVISLPPGALRSRAGDREARVNSGDAGLLPEAGSRPATDEAGGTASEDARRRAAGRILAGEAFRQLSSLLEELLAESDPETAALLENGFGLLESRRYDEARSAFRSILEDHPDSVLRGPAQWCLAYSHYLEGGTDNLALAAGRFADFLVRHGNSKPEVLVEAAQLDLAVICMDLMNSDSSRQLKLEAAAVAVASLQSFVDKWPENPQAEAARASIRRIDAFISGMNEAGRTGR